MARVIPLLVMLFSFQSFSQPDPQKLDSLRLVIDKMNREQRSWQDSFARAQDSIYKKGIEKGQAYKPGKDEESNFLPIACFGLVIIATLIAWWLKKKKTVS
jgi:hypothetical protein